MALATIYALSSGQPPAGVAVVRISGPKVPNVLEAFSLEHSQRRVAVLGKLFHPESGVLLDHALYIYFPAPASFTGEDVVEFHLHGGLAVIDGVLGALQTMPGLRMAEAGEFSRRAFENGKLDLTEIEGLSDLIAAETEAQRMQAIAQASGKLSALYDGWRMDLLRAIAFVESSLDFSDEGDVPDDVLSPGIELIAKLKAAVEAHLDDGYRGEILRDGYRTVIAGPPNAGKSSLLNAIARRDVAIVSEEEGTTRDIVSVRLDIGGIPVNLSDTAGIRDAANKVELEGIRRSYREASSAELLIWLVDGAKAGGPKAVRDQECLPSNMLALNVPVLVVWNKVDTAPLPADFNFERMKNVSLFPIGVSATHSSGLEELIAEIGARASNRTGSGEVVCVTRARHRELLLSALEGFNDFLEGDHGEVEFRAEDLRRSGDALGRITGKLDVEDVLDVLFAEFCIGK